MRQSRNFLYLTILTTNLVALTGAYAADNSQANPNPGLILFKATDIKFNPAPGFPKGAEISLLRGDLSQAAPYTIRFKLPDGFIIPSHWHPLEEETTVISGTLNVGMGDKVDKSQSTALEAGGFEIVPANAHHYVWSTGETVFQVDGMGPRTTTFLNPEEWTAMIKNSNK